MKIIIKEKVHIPVKNIRERTYEVYKVWGRWRTLWELGYFMTSYHTMKPHGIHCWEGKDVEKIIDA